MNKLNAEIILFRFEFLPHQISSNIKDDKKKEEKDRLNIKSN
jgi:hypothetical protein